jgi:hypothetical protein
LLQGNLAVVSFVVIKMNYNRIAIVVFTTREAEELHRCVRERCDVDYHMASVG